MPDKTKPLAAATDEGQFKGANPEVKNTKVDLETKMLDYSDHLRDVRAEFTGRIRWAEAGI